jgi:Tfp pilus assembly protein PilE
MKKSILITLIGVIIGVMIIALLIIPKIPKFFIVRQPQPSVKSNMHTLQIYVEDFAERANNNYPASINTTVKEVLEDLVIESDNDTSIAGAGNRDTVFTAQISSSGPAFLHSQFINPIYISNPVLINSAIDPPVWDKNYIGVIYYVPLEVKGNIAKGYKIYGAGVKGLLSMTLTSYELKKEK